MQIKTHTFTTHLNSQASLSSALKPLSSQLSSLSHLSSQASLISALKSLSSQLSSLSHLSSQASLISALSQPLLDQLQFASID
jgi:hypothetical protein